MAVPILLLFYFWTGVAGSAAEPKDAPGGPQPISSWAPGAGFSLTTSDHAWAVVNEQDEDGGGSLHPTGLGGYYSKPWLEGMFTGPAMLEFSLLASVTNTSVVVREAGGVRTFEEVTPATALQWKRFQIPLPAGEHTIRWTFPGVNVSSSALSMPVWLDRLLLTPFPGTLEEAAELPAGSFQLSQDVVWYPVADPSLPDGDALTCAAGFSSVYYGSLSPTIALQCTGPVTFRFHAKPELYGLPPDVYGNDRWDAPVSTSVEEPGGWSQISVDVPPGTHKLAIVSQPGVLLDRFSTSEPWQSWPAAQVVGIPGASVTTNLDNPVVGYSSDGNLPGKVWFSNLPGRTTPWLAMECDGPALLRFTPEFDREPLRVNDPRPGYFGTTPAPLPFTLEVDGLALPFREMPRITVLDDWRFSPETAPFAIYLPPGRHSVRWTLQPAPPPAESASGILGGFSLTPVPALGMTPPGQNGAILILEHNPVTITTEGGEPILKCANSTNEQATDEYLRLLGWRSTGPGLLSFRWRVPVPQPWPWSRARMEYHFPGQQDLWADYSGFAAYLPMAAEWNEVTLASPTDAINLILSMPYQQVGFEISRLRFTPCTRVSLSEAAGLPGLTLDAPQAGAWTGLRRPDGGTLIVPRQERGEGINPWTDDAMSSSITGPVLLKWRETHLPPPSPYLLHLVHLKVYGGGPVGSSGDRCYSEQVGLDVLKSEFFSELVVPSGTHQISWVYGIFRDWNAPVLDQFSMTPIPAAYANWRVQSPWSAGSLVGLPPGGDIDEDGMSNLAEYTWRTDPVAENPPVQPVAGMEGGRLTLCLPEPRPESDGVRVLIETSDDMITWSPAATEVVPGTPTGQVKYRLLQPAAATARTYVRARAEFVPQ